MIHFDAYSADDPNGTTIGELSKISEKTWLVEYDGTGAGSFVINRHEPDQTSGLADVGNYVRVRMGASVGSGVVGAFWIEQGNDTIASTDESGGESYRRVGRGSLAYLERAILYDVATASVTSTEGGTTEPHWTWPAGTTVGQIAVDIVEDALARSPSPLPDLTYDFDATNDSASNPFDVIADVFTLPVGADYLSLFAALQSLDVVLKMDPDLKLSLYQGGYGTDLTASVEFALGANVRDSAERQIFGAAFDTRVLVQGADKDGALRYKEVTGSHETSTNRREGFVQYQRTPYLTALNVAGLHYLRDSYYRLVGPTALGVTTGDGTESGAGHYVPFTDYNIGDTVTADMEAQFSEVTPTIRGILIEEQDTEQYETSITFNANPLASAKSSSSAGATVTASLVADPFFTTTPNNFTGVGGTEGIRFRPAYSGIGASHGEESPGVDAWLLIYVDPDSGSVNFEVETYDSDGNYAALFLGNPGFFGEGNQVVFDLAAGNLNDDSKFYINDGWGLVITQLASDPAAGAQSEQAQIYFNTTLDALRLYASGAWSSILTQATETPPFVPVVGYAECNSPPTTDATANLPNAVPFDTFYDVDGAAGSLPAGLALTYASDTFTATEDGVWALGLGADIVTNPGSAGWIRIFTPDYGYAPTLWIRSSANDPSVTADHTLRLRSGDTFGVDQASSGSSVQLIDGYALLSIVRLADAVQ